MRNRYFALILVILIVAVIFLSGCNKSTASYIKSSCEDALNSTLKNACYEDYALNQQNISYCDKINTPDPFQSGRMSCYIKMAKETGNVSLCFVYRRYDSSAICIRDVALSINDSSLCELDDMESDVCYLAYAVKKFRVEVCDSIISPDVKEKCIDEVQNGVKYYCVNYEAC
jgi:hypothetical protein